MTFSVTIGSDTVEVYGGLTALKSYANTSFGDSATAFNALATDDDRSRVLVMATRFLEALIWQGSPTTPPVDDTTLAWPRTGVVDEYGNAVDSSTVPANLVNGCFELAMLVAEDASVVTVVDQGTNTKGVHAGSAGVDYFVPQSAQLGTAPLLPPIVGRLIGQYMSSAVDDVGGGVASGTGKCSEFARDRFKRSWPF